MILTRTIDSYRFGFSLNLTEPQLRFLAGLFHRPTKTGDVSLLGGRTSVTLAQLDGIGSVVIKYYRRGGLMRYIIKQRYLKLGKTRAQREFELLHTVSNLGINVPEPIAYAHRGHWFYRAWLVTREIKEPLALARLSLIDEKRARRAMTSVTEQISRLIDHNLLHVDLHPGNVVIDQKDRVFLLDFDKGQVYQGNKTKLRNRYINRWQRAVGKHGLPKMLSEMMQAGLQELK
jgi:3-deoxy-D-manno-octulosonic acid kinase